MKKIDKNSVAALIGTTFVGTLLAGTVNAAENPFALKDLVTGYGQVAEAEAAKDKKETASGEGKCGAKMVRPQDDKAAQQQKSMEGKCGAGMKMDGVPAQPPKAQ